MKKRRRPASRKRAITAEDLYQLRIPTSVALSPDERRVVYTVERMDQEDKKYYCNLFVCELASSEVRPFTHGKNVDRSPVWSPDGAQIAFISTRDKKTGIYLMPVTGGSEKKIIELDGAISDLQFHPDGTRLVFTLRYNDSHFIKDEEEKKKAPVYRHITRMFYRLDGAGFMPKDTFQVYTLDIESGKLTQITKGKRDNVGVGVSRDGRWIAYVSNRRRNPDIDLMYEDIFVAPITGGKERKITAPDGPKAYPTFSPDGKTLAYIGHDNPNDAWGVTNMHLWKVGVNGAPKARDLMPKFDRMTYDQCISDLGEGHSLFPPVWSADGKRLYFQSSDTGVTNLFYVPAAGGKPTRVFGGKCHVKAYSLNGRTKTLAIIYSDLNNPGDIMTCPAVYGGEKRATKHTDLNAFLRTEVQLGKTKDLMFKSFDGTQVQGWLVLPPGFNPKKKYPSVLEIHGGPRVQYGYSFFHEMQYIAAKGYVVFYTNPRGGSGRGETWADAIAGGWGGLDYQDCMAAADYLEKQKYINPKRMGVTGGSYGGYMTNWIIGHTNRFRAAVTQRSVVSLTSMYGSSDIGWSLEREFEGTPWTNKENYERCSPITYFKNVKTPVLIIHSENDLRCPTEQGEQMYIMLKRLGKTTELVRFPEEPHGLSRHGRPDRRIARLDFIVKWFDRYMKR